MMFDGVIIYRLCDELICSPSVVISEIYNYNVVVRITPSALCLLQPMCYLLFEFESSIIRAFLSITDTPCHVTTNVGYRIALPLLTYSLVRNLEKAFCELSLSLQMRSRAVSISAYFILLNGIFSNKMFLRCKILLVKCQIVNSCNSNQKFFGGRGSDLARTGAESSSVVMGSSEIFVFICLCSGSAGVPGLLYGDSRYRAP